MRASELFPDKEERKEVKDVMELFRGKVVRVVDDDSGEVLFDNGLIPERFKKEP